MPGEGEWLRFIADVLGNDGGFNGVGGKTDGEGKVGLGEPVAAEIAAMDDACDFLAAGDLLDADVVGLGLQDESMHGMALGGGQLANVVGGKSDGVVLPLRGQSLAIRRQFAANAVGIRRQEGSAEPVT